MKSVIKKLLVILPGLILSSIIAISSIGIHKLYKPVSAVAIAMIAGLLLRNFVTIPNICMPGIKFSVKRILRFAIILLGIRLSFLDVIQTGGEAIGIIVICILLTLFLVTFLAKKFNLPAKLGTLIGVGTCICGNSAIMATAPVIDAEDEDVSFAVATITLFGVLSVLTYPLIGHLLTMTDTKFGIWAGTAINDTSQVVTAGFIYSEPAGNIATVVKMTRNLFMAPVIIIMSILYSRSKTEQSQNNKIDWKKTFPLFVLGFVIMAILRTFSVFPPEIVGFIKETAGFLIVVAIAAAGMGTSFASMKKTGLRPFYVGLIASLIMGIASYALIQIFNVV